MIASPRWRCALALVAAPACGYPALPDDGTGSLGAGGSGASCAGLPSNCGSSHDQSCCAASPVPGGAFIRSFDRAADGEFADMTAGATVSPFVLDDFEVTVGRFVNFIGAGTATQAKPPATGSGAHPKLPSSGWQTGWTTSLAPDIDSLGLDITRCQGASMSTLGATTGDGDNHPINCVTWYEAMAFCIWDGGYLPTEAEWNFAAAGGNEQRAYPWSKPPESTAIDGTLASYNAGNADCTGDGQPGCNLDDLRAVGSFPDGAGKFGHSDLAGNVAEWVLDVQETYSSPDINPCNDCAHLPDALGSGMLVTRGGGFLHSSAPRDSDVDDLRTGKRNTTTAGDRDFILGFRCARPK